MTLNSLLSVTLKGLQGTELTDGHLHASQSQNNALALLHHFPGITNDGRGAVKALCPYKIAWLLL